MPRKKPRRTDITQPSVTRLVEEHFPDLCEEERDVVAHTVFLYALGMIDGRQYSTRLRATGKLLPCIDTERTQRVRDFRARTVYSAYIMCDFWRAMLLYTNNVPYDEFVATYKVHRADLLFCEELLSGEEYTELLKQAASRSIFRISNEDYDWLLKQARITARGLAYRKLRFLEKHDAAFDGEAQLMMEAVRIINTYSAYPSKERILGAVKLSLPREAEGLREYHMAERRRPIRKLPAFRCPECKRAWEHERNKGILRVKDFFERHWSFPSELADPNNLFCGDCSESGHPVLLDRLDGEREYQTTCTSINAPVESDDGSATAFTIDIEDEQPRGDDVAEGNDFILKLSQKLSGDEQRFLHVFLGEDEGFREWLMRRNVRSVSEVETQAALVCEYLKIDWSTIQRSIGAVMGRPKAFLVKVGEGDEAEQDVVFAHSPSHAVHYIAQQARFPSGTAMQNACGRVRVREYLELEPDMAHMDVSDGTIIPLP